MPSSQSLKKIIATLLSGVSDSLKAPVCRTLTEFNCHSEHVRMEESASGNWFADVLRHTYDDALCVKGHGGADGVLICGGTIRGDCSYGPGIITVGDIMEILPFEDPIVVKELDGPTLWAALEGGLGKWPAQEGRFPIISGFRIEWDSRKPPGSRVLSIWTEKLEEIDVSDESNQENTGGKKTILRRVNGDPVSKDDGGKKYYVVTREYMAAGHDGYEVLKDCPYVGGIDDEYGMMMSTIVRKFLLGKLLIRMARAIADSDPGSQYIKQMKLMSQRTRPDIKPIDSDSKAVQRWKLAGQKIIQSISSKHTGPWICDALKAANTHHMSSIDCYDGNKARDGKGISASKPDQLTDNEKLVVVAPVVDGRLRNVAKAATVSS
ncbi:hypothetical protein FRC03_006691 [Tulasnella sp. 419]|nr:hypothetical protein FRC03_006691 [Tulasnella sp. 419]